MRHIDWSTRLWQVLDAAAGRPFEYGRYDCVHLTAECVDAILVRSDYCSLLPALYADKRQAVRLLMRAGGMDDIVTQFLGAPVSRGFARRGDVASLDLEAGPALGVVVGPKIAVAAQAGGVLFRPVTDGRGFWQVD